ncbi:AraC-type DNA-binding protein [Actinopolyspora mzabensis]|uniref:AraC-type DNA-binding protein n=1 Tax=Actinopolyspora mzabensis TaxID=995066 RepID=A0A1G8Y4T4_ACTMZ|nr:AraC family transcriptional regulator [Actinopolyspora mzabensis]SDJ97791.1 AraC-type DNA-binding protein [Actinopolyspora mzabensis]
MHPGIKNAISLIRTHYDDPITLGDLASAAFFSPFHFSRVFSGETGVTPGRYLTAVRLFEAKRMLLTSSLTVSDIVCSVGYSSVGTFTSRFTKTVGMTPTEYRQPEVNDLMIATATDFFRLPAPGAMGEESHAEHVRDGSYGDSTVEGTIELPCDLAPANVFVGLFDSTIPQSAPLAYEYITHTGTTRMALNDVPSGRWSVLAVAQHVDRSSGREQLHISGPTPVSSVPHRTSRVRLRLRPLTPTDPPIAVSLAGPRPNLGRGGNSEHRSPKAA